MLILRRPVFGREPPFEAEPEFDGKIPMPLKCAEEVLQIASGSDRESSAWSNKR
jgi:hypothetical protein